MFKVLEAGGLVTIQDSGRRGARRFGVPVSGPMDPVALQAANRLVGNPAGTAALEVGLGDVVLAALQDGVIGAAGCGYSLTVAAWTFPLWSSCFVRAGWRVKLEKTGFGMWVYLAVAGGLDCENVLGSRSTYLRGHFGGLEGRLLQAGDVLRTRPASISFLEAAARSWNKDARPSYSAGPLVEVILGPQSEYFDPSSLETFLSSPYKVSATSDRMGYRLEGPPLNLPRGADLTSEGMTMGAVQVPSDGQPIVMMADCATAGGYPKIATVITADLPLLAQCTPGKDSVCFRATTVEAAQEKLRLQSRNMENGIVEEDEN